MTADIVLPVFKSTAVEKVIDPIVDEGNLLLVDRDPIEDSEIQQNLLERARNNAQFLFNKIWELEKKRVDEAIVAVLPRPSFRLPREKRLPDKRVLTKWESYAQQKGIVKQKKDRKVLDEATGEWKPRYGYRSAKNEKQWMMEMPDSAADDVDLFEKAANAKKERVQKNELQRLRNIARQMKAAGKAVPVYSPELGISKDPSERTKQELRVMSDRSKVATASVGKFQDKLKGEKKNVKKGIKRKFDANAVDVSGEKTRALSVISKIGKKKGETTSEVATVADKPMAPRKNQGKQLRQKSQIKRQQFYERTSKVRKNTRGGVRKDGKK